MEIKNLSTGETNTVSRHGLALGTAERFEPRVFYEQPQNECFYYCDAIDGDLATLYLVESFQMGQLIQAKLKMKTKFASYYSPVSDPEVVARRTCQILCVRGGLHLVRRSDEAISVQDSELIHRQLPFSR